MYVVELSPVLCKFMQILLSSLMRMIFEMTLIKVSNRILMKLHL